MRPKTPDEPERFVYSDWSTPLHAGERLPPPLGDMPNNGASCCAWCPGLSKPACCAHASQWRGNGPVLQVAPWPIKYVGPLRRLLRRLFRL